MAYLTLFPIRDAMRANMMVYRRMDDPWLRRFRQAPEATMLEMMPGLRRMAGEFKVIGPVKIRPADLYVSQGHRQAGVVLVGDAFSTSCPAAGTGTDKVFTDVERLCNVHIPNWLATDGMGAEKIAAFYDDPVKTACDAWSTGKAYHLRSLTIDNGVRWRAQRWARFLLRFGQGTLRRLRGAAGTKPMVHATPVAAEKPASGAGQRRVA
jgi:2-polyprenyl-6-methoxyphenol hydroxylase-like FAD-dependent oxidoreductase